VDRLPPITTREPGPVPLAGRSQGSNEPLRFLTVGEYAERILASFANLDARGSELSAGDRRAAAAGLVEASLALMRKLPQESRWDFASTLPFSTLELELLHFCSIREETVADAIADRLVEWIHLSPVLVGHADVHVADFLQRLEPHLDRWSQREAAIEAMQRLRYDLPTR
jgi:hypothetical protein